MNPNYTSAGIDVHTSISRITYSELSQQIEWASELFFTVLMKISYPANMVPALVLTYVNYFVLDLGDDSFYLPFPTM